MSTLDHPYMGHFGGPTTPKSVAVDLTVITSDRPRPYMVGSVRVATYNGRVTKASLVELHAALAKANATEAWAWMPKRGLLSGWRLLATRGVR